MTVDKLARLEHLRKQVVESVENHCTGASEVVIPAIFKQNVLDLTDVQRLRLETYAELFLLGEMIGESKRK